MFDVFGTASIGIYLRVTEKYFLAPRQIPFPELEILKDWFKTNSLEMNIGGSVLLGSLICANSNGVILPQYIWPEELEILENLPDVNITLAETRRNAYGNLVLANDFGAIVDPRLRSNDIQMISDTLGVETVKGKIAGLPYVGSLGTVTNKGSMVHPLIEPEEEQLIKDVLKVPVGLGTINRGLPYIATGLIGNSEVSVAGSLTTGPELLMIGQALGVAD